jgi:hypothetical protein
MNLWLELDNWTLYYGSVAQLVKGGFPPGEIFFCLTSTQMELNINLLNLNNRNFGSIEKFRLVENRLKALHQNRRAAFSNPACRRRIVAFFAAIPG